MSKIKLTGENSGYVEISAGQNAGNNTLETPTSGTRLVAHGGSQDVTLNSNLTVSGNVSVGGTLTYEDVTNIDSVGVITARAGINATGDITFGTSSKAKLFENGTQSGVQATSSSSSAHLMTHDGNEDIHVDPSGYIKFEVAGSERLRIDSAGRLGLGANNNSSYDSIAQNFLIANESSHAGMTIRSGGSGAFGAIHFADGVSDNTEKRAGRILYGHSGDFMNFYTANTERLRIDSSGRLLVGSDTTITDNNFGIGNLQVTDTTGYQHVLISGHSASAANATCLSVGRSRGSQSSPGYLSSGDHIARLSATSYNGGNYQSSGCIDFYAADQHASNDLPGYIALKTVPDGSATLTERLRIQSNGRVGINRATSSFMLDIVGNSSTGANCIRIVDGAETGHGSHPAKIVAGGTYYQEMQMHSRRFTVHTWNGSNIAERFRVHQDGTVTTGGLSSTPGTVAAGSFVQAAANAGFFSNGIDGKFGTASSHPLYLQVNGVTKATVTTGGAFSVGTTSPQQPNVPSIHVHSSVNDDARIAITTPSKPNSRIGYFGLSNKFGIDVHNGFEVRDASASYATRLAINSTGVVTFGGQSYANATKSGGVNVSSSCYFDITGSSYVFVKIMIKVGYSGNAGYQMHAQYDYVTCNYYTTGSTATRTDILQVEAANAQFNYSDISISRPSNRTVRVTYAPSSGAGTHHPALYVSGVFDSITVS